MDQDSAPGDPVLSSAYLARVGPGMTSSLEYCGLDILELGAGERHEVTTGERELILVPLEGGCTVAVGSQRFVLQGRPSPWAVTDVLYLPIQTRAVVSTRLPVRIALPWAFAANEHSVQYLAKSEVVTELRGAGICSRQVNNFGTPEVLRADRIIACEVLQPGGNWSSYPPHKHDEDREDETRLEEIYYYEVARSPVGTEGFGLQRAYSSPAGEIDLLQEVRTGDIVVIPYGYHGPSVAAPGHDLYYLNVMAGPRTALHPEREWLIADDPDHAWLRREWEAQAFDPRLPFG